MSAKRYLERIDLSDYLIHFTKPSGGSNAPQVFSNIIMDRELIPSSGKILGEHKCICFTEAPIPVLIHGKASYFNRYSPFGFMFSKSYIFELGGRPVIYSSKDDYNKLHDDFKYKHVTYDPTVKNQDFSWEREWRLKEESLSISEETVVLVLPNELALGHVLEILNYEITMKQEMQYIYHDFGYYGNEVDIASKNGNITKFKVIYLEEGSEPHYPFPEIGG